jgi:hypothetical protein
MGIVVVRTMEGVLGFWGSGVLVSSFKTLAYIAVFVFLAAEKR